MAMVIIREPEEFIVDRRVFPVTVDYNEKTWQMIEEIPLAWMCNSIPYEKLAVTGEGIQEFDCFYVIVGEYGASFERVIDFCKERGVNPAKAELLFSFGKRYPQEYDERIGRNRIIAGGSTWLCSHECFDEMLALSWTTFHHHPGRELSVVSNLGFMDEPPFIERDRFLATK